MSPDSARWLYEYVFGKVEHELGGASSVQVEQLVRWLVEDALKQPPSLRAVWVERAILSLRIHQPYSYVVECTSFMGLELWVAPPVLVPRPETEELAQLAFDRLRGRQDTKILVVDAFTGSGAIALYLKSRLPQVQVAGFDCEMFALAVARYNARRHNLAVNFFYMDIASGVPIWEAPTAEKNLVVANPPYVGWHEREIMAPETRWEHSRALFAPRLLFFYERLLEWAENAFGGRAVDFVVECNEFVVGRVAELYSSRGYDVRVEKDFYGKERFVIAQSRQEHARQG